MEQWNGRCGNFIYVLAKKSNLLIDSQGDIYFTDDDKHPRLWCAKNKLRPHLLRLWRICGESTVIKITQSEPE